MARITDLSGRPFAGLVPHAVIAIVVDNVDPDELGRIKVKFPTLNDEPESWWLRQVSPNGGIERGLYALPEIDDEVLVLFLQGSQDVGVIIGQFWNGVDKPPTEAKDGLPGSGATDTGGSISTDKFADGSTSLDDNDRRFWRSRSGHLLVFDDTSGSETVQIWDGSHTLAMVFDTAESRVLISNSSGDVHIRTKNDLYLEAGNDIKYMAGNNIEGEAKKDLTVKAGMNYSLEGGMEVTGKSGTNMTLEAGANFEAKATANMKLEGIMWEANGSATSKLGAGAMVEVKAGIVMIN
jgi:phage baseplate assembly protein gpV